MRPEELLDRLRTEVRVFRCANLVLERDLRNLIRTLDIQAYEAVIIYCSRILEVLAANALEELGEAPYAKVHLNLDLLRRMDLFSPALFQWANALRHLGNDVRHVRYSIGVTDAELACLLLERWLEWFFCSFPLRTPVPSLTRDGDRLALTGNGRLLRVIEEFEDPGFDPRNVVPRLENDAALSSIRGPGVFSLVAEILLDRQEHKYARATLDAAIKRFPGDLRLLQLRALRHGHLGKYSEALALLEPALGQRDDDTETGSILAGVLKRMWWADRSKEEELASFTIKVGRDRRKGTCIWGRMPPLQPSGWANRRAHAR